MGITQDEPGVTNAKGARADLGDMNLNALFTGATCVRVANEREASLEVTKKVDVPDGLTGNKDAGFTFNFTVPAGKTYKAAVFEKAGTGGRAAGRQRVQPDERLFANHQGRRDDSRVRS